MRFLKSFVFGILFFGLTGCGGNNEVSVKVVVPPATELLKHSLKAFASSGEPADSSEDLLHDYVDRLSKEDATKAKALSPMVDTLVTLKDPAKIKAMANEMLKLL